MRVEISLLGRFSVRVDGRPVPDSSWSRRDAAALVKVLALSEGRQLHREQVVEALWPGTPVAAAAPRVHKAAHYARRALGSSDAVVVGGDMVSLLPGHAVDVDVAAFAGAADTALRSGSRPAAESVLDSFASDPLPADVYADWAGDVRERVARQRRDLLRQARRWEELADADPFDEEAHVALAADLAERGDPRAALMRLERLDRSLRRELDTGLGPAAIAWQRRLSEQLRSAGQLFAADAGQLEQEIRFCRSRDGVTLAYAMSGSGSPLVKSAHWLTHVDHDWESAVWQHWLVDLSRRHRLIRYDERGCGLSDRDVGEHTFEDWVTDLEAVVDAAGLDTFPILGVSQGAAVAVAYAVRHPERVSRLVLYGGYVRGRVTRSPGAEGKRLQQLLEELVLFGWGTDQPTFRQVFSNIFMPHGSRELWDDFNELQRQSTSPENAAHVIAVTGSVDVSAEAGRVRAPTLVLHARGDQGPPFDEGRLLAASIPGARFVALESDNHILLGDEPAWPQFLNEVQEFLADR